MSLIRLHPLSTTMIDSLQQNLLAARQRVLEDSDFLDLPWRQHNQYQQIREASSLGHVFHAANSLHDHIDAVVVVGHPERTAISRALLQACCNPYHNETDRAARGSKPRMYFADASYDTDAFAALMHRLKLTARSDTVADRRFAVVIAGDASQDNWIAFAARKLIQQLQHSLGETAEHWLPRLILPIGDEHSIQSIQEQIACEIQFPIAVDSHGFDALSPIGLLPAAMLGLDCMRLLGGAHAITEHFRESEFEQNIPLQLAAQLAAISAKASFRMGCRQPALTGFVSWFTHLCRQNGLPITASEFDSNLALVADINRHDPMPIGSSDFDFGKLNLQAETPLAKLQHQNSESAERNSDDAERNATLTLPSIDIFSLGQTIQTLLIALAIQVAIREFNLQHEND